MIYVFIIINTIINRFEFICSKYINIKKAVKLDKYEINAFRQKYL